MTETNTDRPLGDMLRQHRESIGLSVRTLATKAGFSPSFISQVENGLASPSIGSLEKIAACLDVTLSELFRHQNEPLSGVVRVKDRPRMKRWPFEIAGSATTSSRPRLDCSYGHI
jgi:transcriptional regulator with XRE-family HTH domain